MKFVAFWIQLFVISEIVLEKFCAFFIAEKKVDRVIWVLITLIFFFKCKYCITLCIENINNLLPLHLQPFLLEEAVESQVMCNMEYNTLRYYVSRLHGNCFFENCVIEVACFKCESYHTSYVNYEVNHQKFYIWNGI